jgi:hypothetical protein
MKIISFIKGFFRELIMTWVAVAVVVFLGNVYLYFIPDYFGKLMLITIIIVFYFMIKITVKCERK